MKAPAPTIKTIMLISGAFVTTDCWGGWKPYFESHGYTVIMPAWPYKDDTVNTLRSRYNKSSIPPQYDPYLDCKLPCSPYRYPSGKAYINWTLLLAD